MHKSYKCYIQYATTHIKQWAFEKEGNEFALGLENQEVLITFISCALVA